MRASTLQYALVLALLGSLSTVRGRAVLSDRADISYDADALGACLKGVKCLPVTDYLATDFDGAILPILPRARGSGGHDDGSGDGDSHSGGATTGGDGGSLDSTASKGSQSSSDEDFPQGPASQAPVDIVARGYSSVADQMVSSVLSVEIRTRKVDGPVDLLSLDLSHDSIGVEFAQNRADKAEDNPGKVPLRTILIDSWQRHSGKQISDLKSVNYQFVVEEQMKAAIPKAYQAAGRDFNEDAPAYLTVLRDTNPQSAYSILMNTPFGGGAQKMLAETAGLEGRTIDSIDLFPEPFIDVQFNF